MERINVWINKQQSKFLKDLPGTLSEHIRRAIDDYIKALKGVNVSASASKRKGGE